MFSINTNKYRSLSRFPGIQDNYSNSKIGPIHTCSTTFQHVLTLPCPPSPTASCPPSPPPAPVCPPNCNASIPFIRFSRSLSLSFFFEFAMLKFWKIWNKRPLQFKVNTNLMKGRHFFPFPIFRFYTANLTGKVSYNCLWRHGNDLSQLAHNKLRHVYFFAYYRDRLRGTFRHFLHK